MAKVSIRLVRTALFASAASLVSSYAASTLAQIPISQPEAEPQPEPGVAPAPASPEAVPAAAATPPAPPAAAAAPLQTLPPAGLPSSRTPPAKTNVITEPGAPVDDDSDDEAEDARLGSRRKWYGWQTLTADGASFAVLTMAVALGNQDRSRNSEDLAAVAWFGVFGYELAPGIIHFVHRNPGRGFASMGLRLGMPLAGAFLGASAASGCSDGFGCEADGIGLGILLGMSGAIAIDAAVLAYDDPKTPSRRGMSLMPLVAVTQRQAWVGFGGQL
jgi:hypothetical protein